MLLLQGEEEQRQEEEGRLLTACHCLPEVSWQRCCCLHFRGADGQAQP